MTYFKPSFRLIEVQVFSQKIPPNLFNSDIFQVYNIRNFGNVYRSISLVETIILSTRLPIFGRGLYCLDQKNVKKISRCVALSIIGHFFFTHISIKIEMYINRISKMRRSFGAHV